MQPPALLLLMLAPCLCAQQIVFETVGLKAHPYGFLDAIGMSRSATTPDSVSTRFGRIPLVETPAETIASVAHSRLNLRSDYSCGEFILSGYLESDFMNPNANQGSFRWRQYWGQVKYGKWELLGGRAWSMLRPNRVGIASETNMMNTDVVDPAYHVGVVGARNRQIRLKRDLGSYSAAFAWETLGNFVAKVACDRPRSHLDFAGYLGHRGQRGVSLAGTWRVTSRARLVWQEYWSRRGAYQALAVVPPGVNGGSTIEGVEAQVTKAWELYAYGGLVYAARSPGNRVVRQWSLGFNRRVPVPSWRGSLLLSAQFSMLDRAVWDDGAGEMTFLMYRFRYTFNN